MSNIVTVNTTVEPPKELKKQQKAVFVSQGGTTLTAGTTRRLTSENVFQDALSDGYPLAGLTKINAPITAASTIQAFVSAITSLTATSTSVSWAAGVTTISTVAPHTLPIGAVFQAVFAGFVPIALNGVYTITVTTASAFTIVMAVNPGTVTTQGTISCVKYTSAGHPFTVGSTFYGMLADGTGSKSHQGVRRCFAFDANTIYGTQAGGIASYTGLTTGYIGVAQITATAHGVSIGAVFRGIIKNIAPSAFNYKGMMVAKDANTILSPCRFQTTAASLTRNPVFQTIKLTTLVATTYPLGYPITLTTSGQYPGLFSGSYEMIPFSTTELYYLASDSVMASNRTGVTTLGIINDADAFMLSAMWRTWDNQNEARSEYLTPWVLELGNGTLTQGIALLNDYITQNPDEFYAFVLPRGWYGQNLKNWLDTQYGRYFFVTSNTTFSDYGGLKCVASIAEPSTKQGDEYHASAYAYNLCNFVPEAGRVNQLLYSGVYGLTPWDLNDAQQNLYTDLNISLVIAAPTGTSVPAMIIGGESMDGLPDDNHDLSWWRSINYCEIECQKALESEIIEGSNGVNPLVYNQTGIDRLRQRAQSVIRGAYKMGIIAEDSQVIAVDFQTYKAAHPDHWTLQQYNGLSVSVTPQRGFKSIILNLFITRSTTGV